MQWSSILSRWGGGASHGATVPISAQQHLGGVKLVQSEGQPGLGHPMNVPCLGPHPIPLWTRAQTGNANSSDPLRLLPVYEFDETACPRTLIREQKHDPEET